MRADLWIPTTTIHNAAIRKERRKITANRSNAGPYTLKGSLM